MDTIACVMTIVILLSLEVRRGVTTSWRYEQLVKSMKIVSTHIQSWLNVWEENHHLHLPRRDPTQPFDHENA
jgi:hypothetical protein